MDAWGWEQLRPWLAARIELSVGPLFCVIDGPTRGRPWSSAGVRQMLALDENRQPRRFVSAFVRRLFATRRSSAPARLVGQRIYPLCDGRRIP